jgi:hypothetical protein
MVGAGVMLVLVVAGAGVMLVLVVAGAGVMLVLVVAVMVSVTGAMVGAGVMLVLVVAGAGVMLVLVVAVTVLATGAVVGAGVMLVLVVAATVLATVAVVGAGVMLVLVVAVSASGGILLLPFHSPCSFHNSGLSSETGAVLALVLALAVVVLSCCTGPLPLRCCFPAARPSPWSPSFTWGCDVRFIWIIQV